jgi:hypothetical protein
MSEPHCITSSTGRCVSSNRHWTSSGMRSMRMSLPMLPMAKTEPVTAHSMVRQVAAPLKKARFSRVPRCCARLRGKMACRSSFTAVLSVRCFRRFAIMTAAMVRAGRRGWSAELRRPGVWGHLGLHLWNLVLRPSRMTLELAARLPRPAEPCRALEGRAPPQGSTLRLPSSTPPISPATTDSEVQDSDFPRTRLFFCQSTVPNLTLF